MGFGGGGSKPSPAPTPPPAPMPVQPKPEKAKFDLREKQRRASGRAKSITTDFNKLLEEEAPIKRPILSDLLG